MFRELRRKNQQLSETEARSILKNGTHGVLSVQGDGGYPYGVPIRWRAFGAPIRFPSVLWEKMR